MSIETDDSARIENEASEWILRRDRGSFTTADRAGLEAWLSSDSRHRDAYLKLLELWRLAGDLKAWRPIDGVVRGDVLVSNPKTAPKHRHVPLYLTAAAALVACAVILAWYVADRRSIYATEVGGYQRLLLDDGSLVQLNTDTKLQVRVTGEKREVQLLRGEAFFDIARDPKRPFDVLAGSTVVRALGTAFSVRMKPAERVAVVVTQGRVSVREPRTPAESASDSQAGSALQSPTPSVLEAGQTAEAGPSGIRVAKLESAELTRRLSWRSGVLHFKTDALATVVAEFNRYNRRQIEIVDPELAAVEIGGSFKANDLESFVAALRGIPGIRVDERDGRIRLSGSP